MNKQDLIEAIAKRAAISKKSAALALDAMLGYVATMPEKKAGKKGKSAARVVSKPKTGAVVKGKSKTAA